STSLTKWCRTPDRWWAYRIFHQGNPWKRVGQAPAALDTLDDGSCPKPLQQGTTIHMSCNLEDPPPTPHNAALRRCRDSIAGRLLFCRHLQADYKDLLERTLRANNRDLSKIILSCPGFSPTHHLPSSPELVEDIAEDGRVLLLLAVQRFSDNVGLATTSASSTGCSPFQQSTAMLSTKMDGRY
ncbi:hypothetical protein BKA70DRAFT_1280766, partial [Coprinopsis sp. MPI-PUGE-AT-0042]